MLRSLFRFEWQRSPAHLLLLSKFLHPRTAEDYYRSDDWKTVLRENPQEAVKRFLDEGMIAPSDLAGHLTYKYKVSDLREMLKEHGLPASGRKDDLAARLVQADPGGMKKAVAGLTVFQCSERGQEVAEHYLAHEREKRVSIEQQVMDALRQHKSGDASRLVASFEAEQVFPRGLNIDWKNHDPAYDVAMLNSILRSRPTILGRVDDSKLEQLRFAAGMMHLWGTNQAKDWLPADFDAGLTMDNDAAARMLVFHASFQRDMSNYRQVGVKSVKVLGANDSCDSCQSLSKRKFKLNEVPELPYEKCTSEMGCRCVVVVADF